MNIAREKGLPAGLAELLDAEVENADRNGQPSKAAIDALRMSGLLGSTGPRRYGGAGRNAAWANQRLAELARADPSVAILTFHHMSVVQRVARWGDEEQRQRLLPRLLNGTWLAANALSETGAGAGKRRLATAAVRQAEGGWRLQGVKSLCTGSGIADLYLVLVKTEDVPLDDDSCYGAAGQTLLVVPADLPGVRSAGSLDLAGMRGSATGFVAFDDCLVPSGWEIGPIGGAQHILHKRHGGLTLGSVSVGIARAAFRLALADAREADRVNQPGVRRRLSEVMLRLAQAEALVAEVGRAQATEKAMLSLLAKVAASECAEKICREVQQTLGGRGFLRSHCINRLVRDARAVAIMGPTNDICLELVAELALEDAARINAVPLSSSSGREQESV